jgi:transposase-like protein
LSGCRRFRREGRERRAGSVPKPQRRFEGFDDRIVAMYGRGMSVRDIQAHLRELYGVEVGHDLISRVTDAVLDDVREWQSRPLEDLYPILFLDALLVKVRDGGAVRNRACYVAIGVNLEGARDVLGLWFQQAEGAKFWLQVLTELKQRGIRDVLICCVDGLNGFPEAIEAVFPNAWVQTCIVHLIRQSLRFVPDKHRRAIAKRPAPDLHRRRRRRRPARARAVRNRPGRALPHDRHHLARRLRARHPLPRLPRRRQTRRLHHG